MIKAKLTDCSGTIDVTFAREQGTAVLGMTAEDYMKTKLENQTVLQTKIE